MIRLNFPEYSFHIQRKEDKNFIFDLVRKKYVKLTPEEWVRQHVLQYLITEKSVPAALISVESEISLFKTRKRFDVLVSDRNGQALLVVECKAPTVPVTQAVVDQAVRYNLSLKVNYIMLTNGLVHIFCQADPGDGRIRQINDLPDFPGLLQSKE